MVDDDEAREVRPAKPTYHAAVDNDEFFGTPPEARPRRVENADFFGAPTPEGESNATFFGDAEPIQPPPTQNALDLPRDARRFAMLSAGIGLGAILTARVDIVQQIVVIAPIFEESLKFGVALFLAIVLGITRTSGRVAVALAPGALFGTVEHFLSYSGESIEVFAGRVAFHAGTAALSIAVWCALEPLAAHRVRWLSTAPSMAVHAVNNTFALIIALLVFVTKSPAIETGSLAVHAGIIVAAFAATTFAIIDPAAVRELVARAAKFVRLT